MTQGRQLKTMELELVDPESLTCGPPANRQPRERGRKSTKVAGHLSGRSLVSHDFLFQNPGPPRASPNLSVAETLANKGFTVRQLLIFYVEKEIPYSKSTNDVVRDIIIPETAKDQCCYMKSEFMQKNGGAFRAKKLVSHAWKSRFSTTVLNILLDSTGGTEELLKQLDLKEPDILWNFGASEARKALHKLEDGVLDATYWLCVFGINEHKCICGECFTCKPETAAEYRSPVCTKPGMPCYGKPKFNPCSCGSTKYRKDDALYELDKFDDVVALMEFLVVSLDPDLDTLTRIWVVAEIAEAVKTKPMCFRIVNGLADASIQKLLDGQPLLPPVSECHSSSPDDKANILAKIGGVVEQAAFDEFVSCMVETQFGVFHRLEKLSRSSKDAFQRLRHLDVDLSWAVHHITALSELGWRSSWEALRNLTKLSISCQDGEKLTDVTAIAQCFKELKKLETLRLDFRCCYNISNVSQIGQGLMELSHLHTLQMFFCHCRKLNDVSKIGLALSELSNLHTLQMDFSCEELSDVSKIGQGIADLKQMRTLQMIFCSCRLNDVSDIGYGLKELRDLHTLQMDFSDCSELSDVSQIGQALTELNKLHTVQMTFKRCRKLSDVSQIGQGLKELKKLHTLRMAFSECAKLRDISHIVQGVKELKNGLQTMEMDIYHCRNLMPRRLRVFEFFCRPIVLLQVEPTWSLGAWIYPIIFYVELWKQTDWDWGTSLDIRVDAMFLRTPIFLFLALVWIACLPILFVWLLIGCPGRYLQSVCCTVDSPDCDNCYEDLKSICDFLSFPFIAPIVFILDEDPPCVF